MRIVRACVFLCCLAVATLAVDEHRPKRKDDRGKRNLEYQVSHHYSALPTSYRLERRISTGSQYQNPSQYFPRPYRKGRPHSYPVPYYAVQMEPLFHYSQKDPLYDTNILSLDTHNDDPLTENNQIQDNVDRYGYHKPRIIERPVYIKEPEPIIEIIIKESNVSLPAPPPPPPPPKKKKEQVQVFYVKYEKNPHGTGKDSIIYDKPVPAISPKLPDHEEEEEEEAPYGYYPESATVIPPPSTTLRTVIRPDSETYHSPSGVKVTFGKEGFDYDKRSSKPEDYQPPQSSQLPQGRQLSSFSNTYFKRPATNQNYQTLPPGFRSDARPPQSYRPFSFPPSSNFKTFGRPTAPPQYQQQSQQSSKYSFQSPPFPKPNQQFNSFSSQSPHFSHTISHPPPARFQSSRPTVPQVRQPVPYKPFDSLRPQQPTFSQPSVDNLRPQQTFSHSPVDSLRHQQPFSQPSADILRPQQTFLHSSVDSLRHQQTFSQSSADTLRPQQTFSQSSPINPPQSQQHAQFRPQTYFPVQQQLPLTEQAHSFNQQRFSQPTEPQQNSNELPQKALQQHSNQYNPPQALQQLPNRQPQQNFLQQQHSNHQQNVVQQNLQQQLQENVHNQQNQQTQQTLYHQQINHNQQQHQSVSQNDNLDGIQGAILPPGGQLIPSVSKYEQHISSVQPASNEQQYQHQSANSEHQYQQQSANRGQQYQQQSANRERPQSSSPKQYQQQSVIHEQSRNLPAQQYQQHSSSHGQSQNLSPQQYQQKIIQQFNSNGNSREQGSREVSLNQPSTEDQQQQQLRHFYQQNSDIQQKQQQFGYVSTTPNPNEYQATRKASESFNSTPRINYQSTSSRPSSSTTEESATPSTTTKDPKILEAQLPDEVPDELRQQLLSSGILNNADISILDYDKVGDIPLSALPPDQLANFYGAGGASQIGSGSDPVPAVVQRDGTKVEERLINEEDELEPAASDFEEVKVLPQGPPSAVDLKVVHYDPDTDKGQQVQQKYIEDEAKQVNPVVLNDNSYNRYLPLKVNGTQFPIPDVPELKGKKISSVVVLAPVSYDFSSERITRQTTRELSQKSTDIQLIEGGALKDLLANPTMDNYKKFLESEKNTKSDKQSVILLVADSSDESSKEQEIFMYDVANQNVTKLSGELSSAFVEAAEANSADDGEDTAASNIIETRVPLTGSLDRRSRGEEDLEDSASEIEESKIPVIDPLQDEDMETESSENLEQFVDFSDRPLEDFAVSNSNSLDNHVSLSSGYTRTGHS